MSRRVESSDCVDGLGFHGGGFALLIVLFILLIIIGASFCGGFGDGLWRWKLPQATDMVHSAENKKPTSFWGGFFKLD